MKHYGIALAAILALTATSITQAADLGWNNGGNSSPVFSPVSVTQWSGFYAGVSGGHGWGNTSTTPANPGGTVDNNSNGWTLGGQVGYNMDTGGFVLGGEADLQWASIGYSEPFGGGTFTSRTDMFGTLRARAGVPIGQVMPYGTVGVAYGRGSITEDTGFSRGQTANHFGWTAGVGLEAQATSNLSVKAEYLYVDLGSQAYNLPGTNRDIGQSFGIVRAGVNYKF